MPPIDSRNPFVLLAQRRKNLSEYEERRPSFEKEISTLWRQRILGLARFKPTGDETPVLEEHNPLDSPLYGRKMRTQDEKGNEYEMGFYRDMTTQEAKVILYTGDYEVLVVAVPEDNRKPMRFDPDLLGDADLFGRIQAVEELICGAEIDAGLQPEQQ